MSAKYLIGIINDGLFTGEVAILFPEHIGHNRIANGLFPDGVIAGGFFSVNHDGGISNWGESVSCNVKAREEDKRLIEKAVGNCYSF